MHDIFRKHKGFKAIRFVPKENPLIFVEFEFSQAAYDAVDEFVEGFEIRSSRTKGTVELANDDRRPLHLNGQQCRPPPLRIQPKQLLRRNSEPVRNAKDKSTSPKNKREEDHDANEEVNIFRASKQQTILFGNESCTQLD